MTDATPRSPEERKRKAPTPARRHWVRRGAAALLAGVLLIVAAAGVLLATAPGTAWLLGRLDLPDGIAWSRQEGSLLQGLVLHDLVVEGEGFDVRAARASLALAPDGFRLGLRLRDVRLDDVELRLRPVDDAPSEPLDLADAAAPLPVTLEHAVVQGLAWFPGEGAEPVAFERLELAGRWDQAVEDLRLTLAASWMEARLSGNLALASGRTDLLLEARVDGRRFSDALPSDLDLTARADGGLEPVDVQLASEALGLLVEGPVRGLPTTPTADLVLRLDRWTVPGADGAPVDVENVQGTVYLADGRWQVEADGHLVALDLPVAWSVAAGGAASSVSLERLNASAGEATLEAGGRLDLAGDGDVDLELAWTDLAWPLAKGSPQVSSPAGAGRLRGRLDDWRFSGSGSVTAPDLPPGQLAFAARGGREGAVIDLENGRLLGGELSGSAELSWRDALALTARFQARDLDLSPVAPEWPAVVSGAGALRYTGGDDTEFTLDLARLDGALFGEPLAGAGVLARSDDTWRAEQVALRLGTSSVRADGVLGSQGRARFDIAVDVRPPGWAAERLGGSVRGELAVDSAADFPVRRADLRASGLDVGGVTVERLELRRANAEAAVRLDAEGIAVAGRRMDSLTGTLTGAGPGLVLALEARADESVVDTRFEGRLVGAHALTPRFDGRLATLSLSVSDRALFALRRPAPLVFGRDEWRLDGACLEAQRGGALCLNGTGVPGGRSDLVLGLESVPLGLLRQFVDHGLRTTQFLDGEIRWSGGGSVPPSASAAIDLGRGELGLAGDEDAGVATEPGFIGFELQDGRLDNGRLDLPLGAAGSVRAGFSIQELRFDGTGRIEGEVDLDLRSLVFLDSFLGVADGVDGKLRSRLRLGGTVADPTLDGAFDLSNGRFRVPSLAMDVVDLSLRGRVNGEDRLDLRGRFQAGAGEAQLGLLAAFGNLDDPRFNLSLRGEDLAVARLPDLGLDLSPDLALDYAGGDWRVSGTVAVPRAMVRPVTSFVSRVDESADVVVVAGERQPVAQQEAARPARVTGDLAVRLGDSVRVEMDIASVALGGGLDLSWNGDLLPSANGQVRVDGTVTAWGPRLNIDAGRVRWEGVAVTNPSLDIRAQRDVFGNTVVRTAGVRVSGTARRPDIEAFTRPLTNSERAWAVLVTGSDVNFAQGVGALDVGTYIAPRLFLSYGISLFDSDNVVGLRYDLRRGWGVKATSGQRESGIDLSYTIETGKKADGDEARADKASGDGG